MVRQRQQKKQDMDSDKGLKDTWKENMMQYGPSLLFLFSQKFSFHLKALPGRRPMNSPWVEVYTVYTRTVEKLNMDLFLYTLNKINVI